MKSIFYSKENIIQNILKITVGKILMEHFGVIITFLNGNIEKLEDN